MRRALRSLLWVAYYTVSVAVLLLAAEGLARRVLPDAREPLFSDPTLRTRERPFVLPHPTRGFALAPGFEGGPYRIDRHGLRTSPLPAPAADAPLVMAFGDSATFGWRVAQGDDYPAQLEALLRHAGIAVRVANAGVPSYSSSQVRLYLEEVLENERLAPDLVLVLVNVLWNDLFYATVPGWYPELLVSQRPPRWRAIAAEHSVLLRRLLLGVPPQGDWNVFNPRPLRHYAENLEQMVDTCREAGIPLAFIEPAFSEAQMGTLDQFEIRYTREFFVEVAERYRDALAGVASRHGVPLLSHRFALGAAGDGDLRPLFLDAIHPNAAGNRWIARDLADALAERGLLEGSLPRLPAAGTQ